MDEEKIYTLLSQKFNCAQIMAIMGLERRGSENPELVRAMTGLGGGLGGCGKACGALTGAVAMMGLFAGRGTPEEEADPELKSMVQELVEWFQDVYGSPETGVDCAGIIQGDLSRQKAICPGLITETCQKALELLEDYGFC